jgi:hypothetical protein
VLVERRPDGQFPLRALLSPIRTTRAASDAAAPPPAASAGPGPVPPIAPAPAPPPAASAGPAPAPPAATATPAPPAAAPRFEVSVRESVLERGALVISDAAVRPAARVELNDVRLEAKDFTWPARAPVPVTLRVPAPAGGTLTARGELALASGSAAIKLVLADVDLAPVRPYLPVRARVGGAVSADLGVAAALDPLAITASGTAALADLSLADGDRPLVTAARVETAGIRYTWPATVEVDRLHVERSRLIAERRADGTWPLRVLLTPVARERAAGTAASAGAAAPAPIAVTVRESVLEGGSAVLADATVSPAARFEVVDARLVARDFAWPARGPIAVELRAPSPDGAVLSARGQLGLAPATANLRVSLAGVDLARLSPYLRLRAQVGGTASGDLDVAGTLEPLAVTARGAVALSDVRVADGERPLLTAARVETTGVDYAWPAALAVDRLRVQKPWVLVERAPDGGLAARALLPPPAEAPPGRARRPGRRAASAVVSAAAPARPGPTAWRLGARRVAIDDGSATVVDRSLTPASRVEIAGARVRLRDLAWPARGPMAVRLNAAVNGTGTVEVTGHVRLDASSVDVSVRAARLDVAVARPFAPLRGSVAGSAEAALQVKGRWAPLALSVRGDVTVADAALADGQRTVASAKRIQMAGLDADWPTRLSIGRLEVQQPWSLIERDRDGRLVLLSLLRPASERPALHGAAADANTAGPAARTAAPASRGGTRAAPLPAAAPAASTTGPPGGPAANGRDESPLAIRIGALAVEDGFVRFSDATTTPRFVEEVSKLSVTARALGTAPDTRSQVAVAGQLTGGAPFSVEGVVGPLSGPLVVDVRGTLADLPLPQVNPYVNRIVGWIARKGALDATVRYRIADDRLDATNDLVIEQPEFAPSRRGAEVRERLGVPLDMLVALLKDARGDVKLSVPITGDVRARQFDFGDAFWEGLRKTVIGVLSLPISWVGKVFYTADARVDTIQIWPVSFEPGSTRTRRDMDAHVERLARFLRDAPGVALLMKPVASVEDVAALKADAVRQRIEAAARESGQPAPAVGARLFAERFPDRPLPADPDAIVKELAAEEPPPDAALDALSARRLELTRGQLIARGGIDAARLRPREGAVPVDASGAGRIEFEIAS